MYMSWIEMLSHCSYGDFLWIFHLNVNFRWKYVPLSKRNIQSEMLIESILKTKFWRNSLNHRPSSSSLIDRLQKRVSNERRFFSSFFFLLIKSSRRLDFLSFPSKFNLQTLRQSTECCIASNAKQCGDTECKTDWNVCHFFPSLQRGITHRLIHKERIVMAHEGCAIIYLEKRKEFRLRSLWRLAVQVTYQKPWCQ